jgi:hypothetical protein
VEVMELANLRSELMTPYSSLGGSISLVSNIVYRGRA